jgi:hypothetical protein
MSVRVRSFDVQALDHRVRDLKVGVEQHSMDEGSGQVAVLFKPLRRAHPRRQPVRTASRLVAVETLS